ncbi:hypothetical protein D043_5277B, partial [Vibrio parahaemolyticus EKP-021]
NGRFHESQKTQKSKLNNHEKKTLLEIFDSAYNSMRLCCVKE